jgi:dTDP-4-dehydrorhamnose 3,5-epimerase|tara:strand:- start:119 stop:652 length:534 start_codon:yes stop_codon:yes gene_type:complete
VKLEQTKLPGVMIMNLAPLHDDRGFFARAYCKDELKNDGIVFDISQVNLSFNLKRGTLRGMHYQKAPFGDPKIVRCVAGRIWDVVVDLREAFATCGQWIAAELSAENRKALLIPEGCAHGFLTLEDNTELLYMMGASFKPDFAAGVRWNDPAFSIEWPFEPIVMNERDTQYPDFGPV